MSDLSAEETQAPGLPFAVACLLARLRARGVEGGDIPHDVLVAGATAAADAGRCIIRLHDAAQGRDALVLGWQDGVAPPLERLLSVSPLRIPRIPTLVWGRAYAPHGRIQACHRIPGRVLDEMRSSPCARASGRRGRSKSRT